MALLLGGAGGLSFEEGDGPNDLPIQSTVNGQEVQLSDGSDYMQDTGITPKALSWKGTFEINDNHGTPRQKAALVEHLRDSRTRTTLSLGERSWRGFVSDATLHPHGNGRVGYEITFTVEVAGTLTQAAARSGTQSHQAQAKAGLDRINQLAPLLSVTTQAANLAVQAARQAAGY